MPSVNATYGAYNYGVNQRLPDIPFYVQYGWKGGKGWLRLSGIIRDLQYHNAVVGENSSQLGMAVKLSGVSPLTDRLNLYSQTVFGKGIASYVQDLQGQGLDMVNVDGASGKMEGVEVVGSYLGLQYLINERLSASTTFSEVKCFLPDNFQGEKDDLYKEGVYFVTNLIWKVSPVLTTGVEYLWGSRKNMDGTLHHNNRVQASLRVNF
jgi:hypothetical protein